MADARDEQRELADEIADGLVEIARALAATVQAAGEAGIDFLPRPAFPPPRAHAPAAPAVAPSVAPVASAPPVERRAPEAAPAQAAGQAIVAPAATPPAPGTLDDRAAIAALLSSPAPAAERLRVLETQILGECRRCKLHRGRNKLVFGTGNPGARIAFVGEGPGADEDRQGAPFVGRAGQLLTKMIEAMGVSRDDVYICNVVKCRPPNNRDPEPDEVEACEGFLRAQLAVVKPEVVVTLGRHAAQTLLRTQMPITRLRGTWHRYEGVDVMPTFHPSFLLRAPEKKREAWADLQQVMARLGLREPKGVDPKGADARRTDSKERS